MKSKLKFLIAGLWVVSILICTVLTWHITIAQSIQQGSLSENAENDPMNGIDVPPGAHILKIESKTVKNYFFSDGTVITEEDDSVTNYDSPNS